MLAFPWGKPGPLLNERSPELCVHGFGRPAGARRSATARFSRTVRLRKMRRPCGTRATP